MGTAPEIAARSFPTSFRSAPLRTSALNDSALCRRCRWKSEVQGRSEEGGSSRLPWVADSTIRVGILGV